MNNESILIHKYSNVDKNLTLTWPVNSEACVEHRSKHFMFNKTFLEPYILLSPSFQFPSFH